MNKNLKTLIIVLSTFAALVLLCVLLSMRKVADFKDKYAGTDLTYEVEGMERNGTYSKYLLAHNDAKSASKTIDVDIFSAETEGDVSTYTNYYDEAKALFTGIESKVTYTVNIPETGFYNVYMEYLIPESRGVAAERAFYINGELPFEDAINLAFSRIWTDAGEKRVDNQGNEIRPSQTEVYDWQSSYLKDKLGYYVDPYKFYFEKGENTITLEATNEPMVIKSLSLTPVYSALSYEEYTANQTSLHSNVTSQDFISVIQGEDSTVRSESSLYAKYDRSAPNTQPSSVWHTVLNYSGGDTWKTSGQWIEWEFEVPEDGFYNFMVKGRQNYQRGAVSNRSVLIDGEIPFKEFEAVSFPYDTGWECKKLSDENGAPYNVFLTKGKHTIRLEATLGPTGTILSQLEDSTYRLNQIYRKLLVYTGPNPDQYRDYKIQYNYPEIMEAMELEEKRLYKLVDDMTELTGQKSDQIASAQTVANQLERFVKRPQKITTEFVNFKDNITALGTAQLNMSETKLDIDYITVCAGNAAPKKDTTNFFKKAGYEIKSFVASFFVDYNAIGDVYDTDDEDVLKVWVLTGRDQVTILKSLIDEEFIPKTGIKVNVEVIDPNALLNAVLAGRGPNVVLSVQPNIPVDYALRGASVNLREFDDFDEVFSHYSPSSYEQFRLDDAVYGLPETQTFNVMFYRKDVMDELGLPIPNTWKELIEELPTIQGSNLTVGIPTAAGSNSTGAASTATMSNTPDLSMYFSLLFQYGGDMYNEKGTHTTVDTEAGIAAFDDYVTYFNDYGLPTIYDAVSRFRSGEMPLVINAYSMYNTLMVSAPEIRGLWDFTLIPGTMRTDENGKEYLDRSDFIVGQATMMLEAEEEMKQKSWEFMKWWAEPEVQTQFGREIEALLGSSARYATANRDAFSNLSWSLHDINILNEQWDNTVGIREVPGGYFTGRHISNAVRKVINDKDDSRETIIDYSIKIDEEIIKKRTEFGMSLD